MGLQPRRPFYAGLADELQSLLAEGEAMRKSLFAAILSVGLLAETAVPVIVAATTDSMQKRTIAAVEGVGGPEMWVLVRRAARQQAPSSGAVEEPALVL